MPNQQKQVAEFLALSTPVALQCIKAQLVCGSLRNFLAILKNCDGYIGNEGGASNMAKALNIPNFSIFSPWISKDAWLTYNTITYNRAVHLKDYYLGDLEKIPKKDRKKNARYYYQLFIPELIKEELKKFMDEEIFNLI